MRITLSLCLATLLASPLAMRAQTFTGPHLLGPLDAQGVTVADVNRDGSADLIYTQADGNTVAIALSNGNGTFRAPVTYGAGEYPTAVAVGDFNGDGKLDLAIATPGSAQDLSQIVILLGNGNGTFQSPVTYTVGGVPNSITVADFNNDGKPDIAVLSSDRKLTILTNTGSSFLSQTMAVPTYYDQNGGHDTTYSVTTGDFNGDFRIDLAYVDSCASCDVQQETYWIVTNTSSGWTVSMGPTGSGTYVLKAGDLDLDGRADLVSVYAGCHTPCSGVNVDYSNGDGTFTRVYALSGGSLNPVPYDATVGDFNNDGKMDLAAIISAGGVGPNNTYQPPAIAILDGLGGRSGFGNPVYFAYPSSDTNIAEGSLIASGFFRGGNGRKDIFTQANAGDNAVAYWLNVSLSTHDPCPYPTPAGVHVCAPLNNQHLGSDNVTFVASARALTQPLIRMTLTIDGTMVFEEFNDRMNHSVQLRSGSHTAVIAEYDAVGTQLRSQVTFTVP